MRFTFKDIHGQYGCYADEHADAMNKLGELENAEQQGLLIITPAVIGSNIYDILEHSCEIEEHYVDGFLITAGKWLVTTSNGHRFNFDEFGKTVFTCREEAEAALEKIKEEQNEVN